MGFGGRKDKRRWEDADSVKRNHGFKVEAVRGGEIALEHWNSQDGVSVAF